MFRLFENTPKFSRTTIRPSGLLYVSSELNKITDRYINYYQNVEKYVNNTNQFARMLDILRVKLTIPVDEIPAIVRERIPILGSMFDITTYQKKGNVVSPGAFYGKNASEVWIGHDERIDKILAITPANVPGAPSWARLMPVKVIRHGHNKVTYPYLDGKYVGPENEAVVISINLPLLAYQMYQWDNETLRKTGSLLPPEVFMTKYVIPNLIRSHLEVTVMNRIFNEIHGLPNDQGKWYSNPFYIQDITVRIDHVIRVIVEQIASQQMTFDEVLGAIPTILSNGNRNIHQLIQMPDSLINHNNRWVFMVAYLPVLIFLVKLDNLQKNNRNLGYRGRTWQMIRFYRNDGTAVSAFSRRNPVTAGFINAEMEYLKLEIENKT